MQQALREAQERKEVQNEFLANMQVATVLQGMYMQKMCTQLKAQEEHAKEKRKKQVFGNGMPKLLNEDKFHAKVVDAEENTAKKVAEVDKKWADQKQCTELLSGWKKLKVERKACNKK